MDRSWLRVPVGPEAEHWSTYPDTVKVLAAAHTVASVTRLRDALTVLEGDRRIQVVFTVVPGSAFDGGVRAFLADLQVPVIPWEQAVELEFGLAITAGSSGDLHRLGAPVLVMPHGIGHAKHTGPKSEIRNPKSERPEPEREVYGLAASQLVRDGRLVPAKLLLSHSEQLQRLRRACPPAVPAALVAGDICFDRITAALPWRAAYRARMGVAEGQRLVVVSSTWGPYSLLGRHPELPARLPAELGADEYRVALVVHPAVWHGHGPWQLRSWLSDARRAGALLIPPREGWRAALVAADHIVGDHGSVTLYGALLGRPTLLAAFDEDGIAAGTAMAELGRLAPRLDPEAPLRRQLNGPGFASLLPAAIDGAGQAAAILRRTFYGLLGIPEPATPAGTLPVPPAEPEQRPWEHAAYPALMCTSRIRDDERGEVELGRYAAATASLSRTPPEDPHLVVDDTEPDGPLRETADVLVRRAESPGMTAAEPPKDVFAAHPGCRILADVHGAEALVRPRDDAPVRFRISDAADPAMAASVVHGWLASGRAMNALPDALTVRLGDRVVLLQRPGSSDGP